MATMKAAVIHEAGGPEVLKIESLPVPTPKSGEVSIRVKAFGLNRSELFTRQGHSPSVKFPRVLGIEAVGVVEAAPGSEGGRQTGSYPRTRQHVSTRAKSCEVLFSATGQTENLSIREHLPVQLVDATPSERRIN
jgi:D-arabinose 1-dehydrogenase-like Zn-dependent alcohol dehydrogenase